MTKKSKAVDLKEIDLQKNLTANVMNFSSTDIYDYDNKDYELNVLSSNYSNDQSVQVSDSDLFIDFFSLPGVKQNGLIKINAVRIYMSHQMAKSLAEEILEVLPSSKGLVKK